MAATNLGSGNTDPHSLNGKLLASAILARSPLSVMIWNTNSAPRGSIWTSPGPKPTWVTVLHTPQPVTDDTCLTCQKPRNPEQQALSQKQVQITFATELANSQVSVYTLMKLLGHESMVTSQRYVTAAGTETRTAAAQNKLYGLLADDH
jgi:hypothetical protein